MIKMFRFYKKDFLDYLRLSWGWKFNVYLSSLSKNKWSNKLKNLMNQESIVFTYDFILVSLGSARLQVTSCLWKEFLRCYRDAVAKRALARRKVLKTGGARYKKATLKSEF